MVSFIFIVAVKLCFQFACYIYPKVLLLEAPPPWESSARLGWHMLITFTRAHRHSKRDFMSHQGPGCSCRSCLVGAMLFFWHVSQGPPPIWYEVKVDYLFILKGHFYTWVCVYMCVVRQRNRFKSVPTHPEIKLSILVFDIFFFSECVGTYLNRFRCLTTIRVQVMSSGPYFVKYVRWPVELSWYMYTIGPAYGW